jgi:hypothetical protein
MNRPEGVTVVNITEQEPLYIKVKLPHNRVFEADVYEELRINEGEILDELMGQPHKYAIWSVILELTKRKYERTGCPSMERNYRIFENVQYMLKKRKTALLMLWENPNRTEVLEQYHKNLMDMGVEDHCVV